MKSFASAQRVCFVAHIASLIFGLAGLLLVLPHPEFIAQLPDIGRTAFSWSMVGGGAVYMISGAAAVAIYAYRQLGLWHWLSFMIPALAVSLSAELLGTSTGFPFGEYHYLTGLGYKIAGLVPFTIPLSWFYLGFSAYLIAYLGFRKVTKGWLAEMGAILMGSVLLTAWDFVLDPAMSQTTMPFWAWDQAGAFFGMPYQNFVGWFGTGFVYMSIATLLWRAQPKYWLESSLVEPSASGLPLGLPLGIYLSNFAFAMLISIDGEIYPPILLGLLLGVLPLMGLYRLATGKEPTAQHFQLTDPQFTDPQLTNPQLVDTQLVDTQTLARVAASAKAAE
ncbi:MAG: carotenoid biosynthesis protein [Phormidesmis sp. RL_2_1]|nr:carotenoid biosynthesis protein [Phormidesmis sp. RL_2_1]